MLVERDDLGLSLGLSPPEARCPSKLNLMPLPFEIASHSVRKKVLASPEVEERVKLRGIDVNRPPAMELEINENAEVSSPNSTASTGSPGSKRGHDEEHDDRDCSRGASDEEDGEGSRKKLRLSKDQSAVLEESFKEHNTLNPKQKLELAKQLNLRPRQVEVWFQNRRARRSKCSKRSDNESESSLESDGYNENEFGSDSDSEIEMELTLDQSEQDEEDNSGSDSEAEDAEESNVEEGDNDEKSGGSRDAEMEELEKEYQTLRNEEQDLLKNLRRHKDEDAIKGQALKNQKALWDKTLEFRFLLQKAFSASNKLPQEPVKLYFCNSDTTVDQAYLELISSSKQTLNSLLELQEALLENNHSITRGNGKDSCKDDELSSDIKGEDDEEWSNIYKSHDRIAGFRNISVDNWHRKTQVITGAAAFRGKLNAFNQNVSDQINGYMRDPNRMIKRMHLRSSSVGIFGKVPALHEKTKEEDGNFDGDPELLDDSEFYLQLLKELFESCDPASSESAFHALKKLHPKKRKVVDRRASKSRKIRYNVHEKMVNFMAPVPMNLPPMAPKLFENLYGMGNSESAAA